ncbi:lanthionine synthetase LanC family protein [Nocardioides bruguierae]|uniref:Lanthionine synthetase C family protein n=1 Tax=Nocardioides bruguierae TaxID=2945102 RepID=A0A9X2D4R6_9ACTN|nr:lanthionine synthetase LanC family protein [Nocardioides bruguierae]MCM0619040.1 hypothetical protein [Nocardioides bruguierae]
MARGGGAGRTEDPVSLARGAADWLVVSRRAGAGDVSLYHGQAGIGLALLEAFEYFGDERHARAAAETAEELAASIEDLQDCSLYFGLAGVAVALGSLGRGDAAEHALDRVAARVDGRRWSPMFELFAGNAGIGLGALAAGDVDLAVTAVTPYLSTADRTEHGVNWAVRPSPARSHHMAHGTLGIVYALAAVGRAAGRADLVDLALAGAADVVARNEAGPDAFLVPHSDPPHRPELIERYSLGWCNGPAGDAQAFRLLAAVTGDPAWDDLVDRCWTTITRSGLPSRIRPGFWDNNGRCCGTAGVLALAGDRIVERGEGSDFAEVLLADLTARATIDEDGVRWSNHEHRATDPELAPHPGWAMGNAGILRELLRYARLVGGDFSGYATQWPDHPVAHHQVAATTPVGRVRGDRTGRVP